MLELARTGLSEVFVNRDCRHQYRRSPSPTQLAEQLESHVSEPHALRDALMEPLSRAIEAEIIPRLMFAHRAVGEAEGISHPHALLEKPTQHDVVAFSQLLLKHETAQAAAYVELLRGRGMMPESIYMDLLAPAARYVGELWEADLCDFVEVTIALGRLQQLLRLLSPDFHGDRGAQLRNCKVLLAAVPGEQHSFGLALVGEFFRRAGWGVCGGDADASDSLPALVRSQWFDAAGFSAGSECRLEGLGECISAVRAASLNDRIAVLVGGPLFVQHPEYAAMVGADGFTTDARDAVVEAEKLVALRKQSERN